MNNPSDLTEYMNGAVERLILSAIKTAAANPREAVFLARFAAQSQKAAQKRQKQEEHGTHIPPFLIASIASKCNLFCKGCYARANHGCGEETQKRQLSAERWGELFKEAQELGVGFILLAGGEPLMRRDVIEQAANVKQVLFPLFTNGTMLNETYISYFDKNRHILPVISMEGNAVQTDERRGFGTYETLITAMEHMKQKGVYYGVSITVTTENIKTVTSDIFIDDLFNKGCKLIFFVEYVPVAVGSECLAPTDTERNFLEERLGVLRSQFEGMIFLSFPGDEQALGGCLAAGRGFFHINAAGGAEPCPFSPFSDTNVKDKSLLDALKSPLFYRLQENGLLKNEHNGGCTLFGQEEKIKKLQIMQINCNFQ